MLWDLCVIWRLFIWVSRVFVLWIVLDGFWLFIIVIDCVLFKRLLWFKDFFKFNFINMFKMVLLVKLFEGKNIFLLSSVWSLGIWGLYNLGLSNFLISLYLWKFV